MQGAGKTKEPTQRAGKKAGRDRLTGLYSRRSGKALISQYLRTKTPYTSCGVMGMDIDCFGCVNQTYGHLWGDYVLKETAKLLTSLFDDQAVVMRSGGDEFLVLLKDISHGELVKRAMELVKAVRELEFEDKDCRITCSVGVCFLEENVSGYTYEQLFENVDWALCRAKEKGKNRYCFCDSLNRFKTVLLREDAKEAEVDVRYLQNDPLATAFEIFEKMSNFESAIQLLLKVMGIRYQLDRITVIRTDIKEKNVGRTYQWISERAPEVLEKPGSFTKEDFLTLFHSYDEYGTTVLQHDDMDMYSEDAQNLLMQGEAKTVLYAAMYCEGEYVGAISYVVCDEKRNWSKEERCQLGEMTKIISAHFSKSMAINNVYGKTSLSVEYDALTGLLSFERFKEEVERIIVGGYGCNHVMVYTDFEEFKRVNRKYGYRKGDQILKEFANYIIGTLREDTDVYFARIISDQFLLFMPYVDDGHAQEAVEQINAVFMQQENQQFPGIKVKLRTGIYCIQPDCVSVAEAIDAANYARRQIQKNSTNTVKIFDRKLAAKWSMEIGIINEMETAMREKQFKVYLQPRYSLEKKEVVGAEALVRWEKEDGSVLPPDVFVPIYEENGGIVELDYYVFEQVAAFLAMNRKLGRRQVPVSVNASALHAADPNAVKRYVEILNRYGVEPSLTEIELTETATVQDYENVKKLFNDLQKVKIKTVMDDFGAGYSVMNMLIDVPVDTMKLDKEFIRHCNASERGVYFLRHIIAAIQGMGFHVVCEGVETEEQAELLKSFGCHEIQGFWYSHPLPMDEYERFMYET